MQNVECEKERNYIFLVYEKKTYYKLRKSSKDKENKFSNYDTSLLGL